MHGARQAGLTVASKAMQLWQVGAGLPLDALKKGAIVEWTCPYRLGDEEIPPVLDALGRNSSLEFLDLSQSGINFSGPDANGFPLVEKLNKAASTLSGLEFFVLSPTSAFRLPMAKLRASRDEALTALRAVPFFSPSGPRREEVPSTTPASPLHLMVPSTTPASPP